MSQVVEAWLSELESNYGTSPVNQLLGLEMTEISEGAVTVSVEVKPEFKNRAGGAHGAVLSALVDSSMLQAARTALGQGPTVATTNLNLTFVKPGIGRLSSQAKVVALRRTMGVAEAKVTDENGELVAAATGTIHIRRPEAAI